SVDMPMLTVLPVIDGNSDTDPAWQGIAARRMTDVNGNPYEPATWVRIAQSQDGLWFAVDCAEPAMSQLRRQHVLLNDRIWLDDSIEIFIDWNFDRHTYVHYVMNTAGARYGQRASIPPDPANTGPWNPLVKS